MSRNKINENLSFLVLLLLLGSAAAAVGGETAKESFGPFELWTNKADFLHCHAERIFLYT
jgi:hypothetical protein